LHNVVINNGPNNSAVTFSGTNETVTGNLTINNGDGSDSLTVGGGAFAVTGAMSINDGQGGSTTSIAAATSNNIGKLSSPHWMAWISGRQRDSRSPGHSHRHRRWGRFREHRQFDFQRRGDHRHGRGHRHGPDRTRASNNVSTTFKAAVSINTGSGNDTLSIGLDADDRAAFQLAPITFKGDAGFDTLAFLAGGFNAFQLASRSCPGLRP